MPLPFSLYAKLREFQYIVVLPLTVALAVSAPAVGATPLSDGKDTGGDASGFAAPCLTNVIFHSPGSAQARLYEKMADDVTLPDAQIAVACRRRADIAFALCNYATACLYYKRAAAFENMPGKCRLLAARSARAKGDKAAADAMLQSVADEGEGDTRNEAWVMLAEEAMQRGDYHGALSLLRKVPLAAPNKCFVVPALLARLTCARKLDLKDSLKSFKLDLLPYAGAMLERDRVRELKGNASSAQSVQFDHVTSPPLSNIKKTDKSDVGDYLLRVGPFESKRHVEALKKKVALHAGNRGLQFKIEKKRSGYLLAIGGFDSRKEAEHFGREKLKKQGATYKIIEK